MKGLVLLVLVVGCSIKTQNQREAERVPSEYEMTCEQVDRYLERCVNQEAVCYRSTYDDVLQCFKK